MAKYVGEGRIWGVARTVSPETSMMESKPPTFAFGVDTAIAYLVGCAAGPTGLIALTTGRYCWPQPSNASETPKPAAILSGRVPALFLKLP